MKIKIIALSMLLGLSAFAATNVVPREANYGDLGTQLKPFRNLFSGGAWITNTANGAWILETNGIITLGSSNSASTITLSGPAGVATATSFTGSGVGLTSLQAANVSGTLPQSTYPVALTNNQSTATVFVGGFGANGITNTANALGTTITPIEWITNGTAAALGAQQVSPTLALGGQGWMTGTSASTNVAAGWMVLPLQGSSLPTAQLKMVYKVGGAAWVDPGTYFDTVNGGFSVGGLLSAGQVQLNSTVRFNAKVTTALVTNAAGNTVTNWAFGAGNNYVRMTCTNNTVISGLSSQLADGSRVLLANASTNYTITLNNEDTTSSTTSRISLSAATYVIKTNQVVEMVYDSTAGVEGHAVWRVIGTQ